MSATANMLWTEICALLLAPAFGACCNCGHPEYAHDALGRCHVVGCGCSIYEKRIAAAPAEKPEGTEPGLEGGSSEKASAVAESASGARPAPPPQQRDFPAVVLRGKDGNA